MAELHHYPIYQKWYATTLWLLERCEKIPRDARYTVSNRLANLALDIAEDLVDGIYSPPKQRVPKLQAINLKLEKLRLLSRLCHDRKYFSSNQYAHLSKEVNETGQMVGGWLKSSKK